jgi:hypothetical protein
LSGSHSPNELAPTSTQFDALIGARPAEGHRRDLLIELLHRLDDAWRRRCRLPRWKPSLMHQTGLWRNTHGRNQLLIL